MDKADGVGLAAPQVGILSRFFVMREIRARGDVPGGVIKMINPKIVSKSDKLVEMEEGCLSLLGPDNIPVFANVTRPESVIVQWIDEAGREYSREFTGFMARIAQHEMDHLDGILFIDHVSSLRREMVINKIKKRKNS
jgi:peptide deformylase